MIVDECNLASVARDGFQEDHHPFTVHGQKELFEREGHPEKVDGWCQVPGKVDRSSYFLLLFLAQRLTGEAIATVVCVGCRLTKTLFFKYRTC